MPSVWNVVNNKQNRIYKIDMVILYYILVI
ncbi:hypothetical protein SAMN04488530_11449 [Asaccharospora irregularis DSM 2635]|uniref:Uncharacterized protein n=1 Tax=Asaccharospora irregularis DSM 2635 TaxID=1121321 RepID=A0A1M5PI91_9FIRM|nr:hypothetical protein SAMN04488530_11449 [Asaccharospora irregularis DSM 2635]